MLCLRSAQFPVVLMLWDRISVHLHLPIYVADGYSRASWASVQILHKNKMIGLQNKRVIVTGGGRGIGLAICTAIIEAGGQVAVLDVLPEPHPDCRALEKSGRLSYIRCDITKQEPLEAGFAQCIEALGGHIDGCVTNAGIGTDKPFLDHTWADFDRVVKVNQNGTFFPAQLAVKQFLSQPKPVKGESRGSIVMIASQAASNKCPGHFLTAYGGSKGFVKSFAMQLSHEMATTGIRVNSVSPG